MEQRLEIELSELRPKVLALVRKFFRASGLDGDPEDVVQDVLLRLWETRRNGTGIRNAEAWAITAARNCCVSLYRKSRKGAVLPLMDDVLSDGTTSGRMEESEAEATVRKAMEKIPPNTRNLLRLRAKGLSLDEIALVTGRPKGSVKTSISAARKEIMKLIKMIGQE